MLEYTTSEQRYFKIRLIRHWRHLVSPCNLIFIIYQFHKILLKFDIKVWIIVLDTSPCKFIIALHRQGNSGKDFSTTRTWEGLLCMSYLMRFGLYVHSTSWKQFGANLHWNCLQLAAKVWTNILHVYLIFQTWPCTDYFMIKQNQERHYCDRHCARMQTTFQANRSSRLRQGYQLYKWYKCITLHGLGIPRQELLLALGRWVHDIPRMMLFNTWNYGEEMDYSWMHGMKKDKWVALTWRRATTTFNCS